MLVCQVESQQPPLVELAVVMELNELWQLTGLLDHMSISPPSGCHPNPYSVLLSGFDVPYRPLDQRLEPLIGPVIL